MIDDPQAEVPRARELILENDARLRLQLDGAHVGLFEWDVVTNQSRWSTGFFLLHGLEPNEEASYELWRGQVHPDDVVGVESEIKRVVEEAGHLDIDYRIIHPTGELRWTRLQAQMTRDPQGYPLSMRGYCGDVTRRKLADAALLESEKLAIAGRMSAALAHEINNPLAAITNIFFLLRNHPSLDDDARHCAALAEQELQRVSHITRQTLSFYRESKTPIAVTLTELLDDVVGLQERQVLNSRIKLRKRYFAPGTVHGFPVELRHVFLNLISNAIQAMPEGGNLGITVRDAYDWTMNRRGIAVSILDTGVGVKPQDSRRLFEPFFSTKSTKGTGLGLWISRGIVQKYDGRISFRSLRNAKGGTTCFRVFLPISSSFNLASTAATEIATTPIETSSNGHGSAAVMQV